MRNKAISAILGVLVAIPLIMAKIKSQVPTDNVRPLDECEVESLIAANTETEVVEIELMTWEYVALADTETIEETTENEPETETIVVIEPLWDIPLDVELQHYIKALETKYEINAELILAICQQESHFVVDCIGDNGKAYGLGQIRSDVWQTTADTLGLGDYKTNPYSNVEMVYYIIQQNLNLYGGDLRKAINGYRHGKPDECYEVTIGMNYADIVFSNLLEITEDK